VNLAYRDVRHNLFRFLLTCFGLSLLLGVVLAMIGIYRGIVVDALTVARSHGVDLWVVEAGSRGPFAEASRIPGDTREGIARLAESLVDRARRQIGMFTSILLLVSAVIIALIIYTMTMEKLRQIAMLKLIGAPDRTIVGMIVQQALALGLTGFTFGALLIANIKDYFPRRVVLEPDNVLALGSVVVLVCLIASALGVRAALKADPATALGS